MALGEAALFQILLVVLFRAPEFAGRDDLRHDGLRKPSLSRLARRTRFYQLLGRVVKDRRTVLRPDIRTLPVERGGIVIIPEYFQQVMVAENLRIICDFNHFRVSGGVGADVFIGRILGTSAHVADLSRLYSGKTSKGSFHAPKTACAKTSLA